MGSECALPTYPDCQAPQPAVAECLQQPGETPDALATRVIAQARDFVVGIMGHEPHGPTVVDE
ncbi:MAG: hypothetical protein PHX87_04205 [Candidatus Peribacteraceae bacterium]|nr:hypothetical protein [Candidatus Peribacteraceae bacterium]MDD5742604.1 hypothetical protein [Candidatus Peribacteraceae bacterium]